ncbi:hypothetical protein GBAR_LOCUS15961, partial [Geodia barretti]
MGQSRSSCVKDMDSSGGQTQTSQDSRELPLVTGTGDSRVGPGITQGASSDGGDGRVVGGGGCAEGTGGEEGGGRERSEESPPGGGPTESDVAHISSILSRLPAIDTAAAADGNTSSLESEIDQVLEAVGGLLSRYPTHQRTFHVSYKSVMAVKDALPREANDALSKLQRNLLSAVAQMDLGRGSMFVVDYTLNLLILLWNHYPKKLPRECDMDHLSTLVSAALDIDRHGEKAAALQFGQDFVSHLMRLLDDSQLGQLEKGGASRRLCQLLSYHEEISPAVLQQVVVGVGMLVEVNLDVSVFVGDNLHVALLFAAQQHASHEILQELIWRLLSLVVKRDAAFVKELTASGVLFVITSIMQKKGFSLFPLVKFLTLCCHQAPNASLIQLLESRDLFRTLLAVIDPETTEHSIENVARTCDFLAYLCSKAQPRHVGMLVDLAVVSRIEACARKWPETCLLQACLGIEGFCAPAAPGTLTIEAALKRAEFFDGDHHVFAKDMLCNETVSRNVTLAEMVYILVQKLLRSSPLAALQRMGQKEFVEALIMLFARDTFSFPQLASRVIFTLHYFVVQMRHKECFEHLRDLC